MSIPVELAELAEAASGYRFGYLITLNGHGHAHVVAVQPVVGGSGVSVGELGRRSLSNLAENPLVTLVWPPSDVDGYSLIVDGEVVDTTDDSVTIRPKRAVLHRPAPSPDGDTDHVWGHDCVEVHLEPSVRMGGR